MLDRAIRTLAPHGPSARIDAEILLGHVLDKPRHWPYVWEDHTPTTSEHERFQHLIDLRASGWPVAYLIGRRAFWSLDLLVTQDVLIPRPETECLVEAVLAVIPKAAKWRIADLGTGSGAVALALARERPECRITATDISAAALEVARLNAEEYRMENVVFRLGRWFDALVADEVFDIIVSNPPYVAVGDPHLSQGDVRFEPTSALTGGPDGLDAIGDIARGAGAHLQPGGWLMLEHGYDQGERVRALFQGLGYREVTTGHDYGGRQRITLGCYS
ncbi:MAG: peptide chain release factor N(5)-glutamine methyltransferase [Gammaproteobacteria bacterium]|nr:peptide chain release factor N(5)-glutamine methyltransferase [Gammaproteobacteria bacterium]NNJ83816.1 peptide chain release factor N(5)-glutamine methyltransferase [Gammaproteobacteria bacterium]